MKSEGYGALTCSLIMLQVEQDESEADACSTETNSTEINSINNQTSQVSPQQYTGTRL